MRSLVVTAFVLSLIVVPNLAPSARADDACRAALLARIKTCASACVERAKAAVDPEVRGRILGYGCTNNCTKLEMFNGNTCPR